MLIGCSAIGPGTPRPQGESTLEAVAKASAAGHSAMTRALGAHNLMSSLPPPNDPDVLDGWRNIADYLGKSVRTAQRWRQEFGMPVHRVEGREGENVYAFRSELDARRRQASRLGGFAASEQDADDRVRTDVAALRGDGDRRSGRAWITWAVGSALLLAVLWYAGWKSRPMEPGPRDANAGLDHRSDGQPARWVVVETTSTPATPPANSSRPTIPDRHSRRACTAATRTPRVFPFRTSRRASLPPSRSHPSPFRMGMATAAAKCC